MSMQVIQHIEADSSGWTSLYITSIPADYTDLLLVFSLRSTSSSNGGIVKLNGTLASYRTLYGDGSSAASQTSDISGSQVLNAYTSNTFSNCSIYIPNYTSSSDKSFSVDSVNENNATTAVAGITAGLVATGSAVSTIELYANQSPYNYGYMEFSSATLYGITAGSDGTTAVS